MYFTKAVFVSLIASMATLGVGQPLDNLEGNSINFPASVEGASEADVIDLGHFGTALYGTPDEKTGLAVDNWDPTSEVNPEELGGYAEGDILVPEMAPRNGMKEQSYRWSEGIVPYVIEGHYSQQQLGMIKRAMADYHRLTCVRFVPYTGQKDYISIQSKNTGCWSSVGRIGGRQAVNMQAPGCVTKKGTVQHELLHALGFMHEQSRPERDDYVTINYNNIRTGSEINFRKADAKSTNNFGVPYDYNSVMHYSDKAFSKNGAVTIEPMVGGVKLGQRDGLSRGDVKKINLMYNCKKEEESLISWLGSLWHGVFGD